MRNARLWLLVGLAISSHVEAGEEGREDEMEEAVEPVSIDEVLPARVGEASGRLSLGAALGSGAGDQARLLLLPGVQLFFGLTRRLGAELSLSVALSDEAAVGWQASAAIKFLLLEPNAALPGVALKLEATPVGEDGEELRGSVGLIHSAWRLTAQGTLGLSSRLRSWQPVAELTLSVSLRATDRLFLMAEAEGEWDLSAGGVPGFCAGPAVKWVVSPSMFVALGAVFTPGGSEEAVRAVLQLQHRL